MEGNFNFKSIKPTLTTPTSQGKQIDSYFKKQMKPTGMSIKENYRLNEKEESLKKRIFKLDKMETLVHTDEFLSKVFNELKQDADELYGYHWNETILNMIFNKYVLNSPKYLQRYKSTRAKRKTRRGEEGIAQIQNDIDKEKEISANAEDRKNTLIKKDMENNKKIDEIFGLGNKSVNTPTPTNKRSKNDTYIVDIKNNKLLAVVPFKATQEEKQNIISKYVGNANYKQLAWYDALKRGIKGVPNEVSDGSAEEIEQEMNSKYKNVGGYEGIPALSENNEKVRAYYSGEDDFRRKWYISDNGKYYVDVNGELYDVTKEGEPNTPMKNVVKVDETTSSSSSGAFSMGLDANEPKNNKISDVTYQNETTASSSSGQYSTPYAWAKNGHQRLANKPAWKGGTILESSVINGDMNYLTDPSAFKKYIHRNEIIGILNEEIKMNEAESFKDYSQRMLNMLKKYAQEDPNLANDPSFKEKLDIWTNRAETGQSEDKPQKKITPVKPDPNFQWKKPIEQEQEMVSEHHLTSKQDKINFILKNNDGKWHSFPIDYTEQNLNKMSDGEVDQIYNSIEHLIGLDETNKNFVDAMKKDLKYTGNKIKDNESENELETQDGLFKGKWNNDNNIDKEPIAENVDLSVNGLASWANDILLNDNNDPSLEILNFIKKNNLSLNNLKEKAKFYASNSKLFPDSDAIKNIMLDLIELIDEVQKSNTYENEPINEKAISKKQQRFMGMVHAAQKNKLDMSHVKNPEKIEKAAHSMTNKAVKDYASTKLKNLPEKAKKKVDENVFGNKFENFNIEKIKQIFDEFKKSPDSEETKNKFIKAKDYIKNKVGNILKLPELKLWLDKNMPELSNYVSILWGNWDLLPTNKITETMKNMNENNYKEFFKEKLKSTGKSLRTMTDKEKKDFFSDVDREYKSKIEETMIDDQPDSMINNQESSMTKSMDSNELNVGNNIGSALEETEENDPEYYNMGSDQANQQEDAEKFRNMLKSKYGVDSVSDLSNVERMELMKSMHFGEPETKKSSTMDFSKFKTNDAEKSEYNKINDQSKMLDFLNKNINSLKTANDFKKLASDFKKETGDNMQHPMSIFASIEQMPSEERNKYSNLENYFKSNMDKSIKESKEKWEQGSVEHKGALHKKLGIPVDKAIPMERINSEIAKLDKKYKNDEKMSEEDRHFKKMLVLAKTFKKQNESINEERKNSAILNVEKLGNENSKNFKSDMPKEDALNQSKTYPKDDGIHKAQIWPDPSKFYIRQDVDQVQKDAKSMADIEEEVLKKTKGEALKNVGNSANENGNEIPKRNLTKDEGYALAMNRGNGMQDIVYDNKPSEKFENRMKKDMGDDVYKTRLDKMEYKSKAPMYNKDTQPIQNGEKKNNYDKYAKGYNNESVTGKYKDEHNKFKLIEFKLSDVEEIKIVNENAHKISLDGMGNKYLSIGKEINENVGYENFIKDYDFYLLENKIFAIEKLKNSIIKNDKNINESSFNKMKHLIDYDSRSYVNTKKSVKF